MLDDDLVEGPRLHPRANETSGKERNRADKPSDQFSIMPLLCFGFVVSLAGAAFEPTSASLHRQPAAGHPALQRQGPDRALDLAQGHEARRSAQGLLGPGRPASHQRRRLRLCRHRERVPRLSPDRRIQMGQPHRWRQVGAELGDSFACDRSRRRGRGLVDAVDRVPACSGLRRRPDPDPGQG